MIIIVIITMVIIGICNKCFQLFVIYSSPITKPTIKHETMRPMKFTSCSESVEIETYDSTFKAAVHGIIDRCREEVHHVI